MESLCSHADVYYGNTKVDSSRIQVTKVAQGISNGIKVVSTAAVDEPSVTIDVRIGCAVQHSKRYVLLAEVPSAKDVARLPADLTEVLLPVPVTDAGPKSRPHSASPLLAQPEKLDENLHPRPRPKADAKQGRELQDGSSIARRENGRAQQGSFEALSKRVKTLESHMLSSETMEKLIQVIAEMQKGLALMREDYAKNQSDVKTLRLLANRGEPVGRVDGVVYFLGALVLVCIAFIASLWTRQKSLLKLIAHIDLDSLEAESKTTVTKDEHAYLPPVVPMPQVPVQPKVEAAGTIASKVKAHRVVVKPIVRVAANSVFSSEVVRRKVSDLIQVENRSQNEDQESEWMLVLPKEDMTEVSEIEMDMEAFSATFASELKPLAA